MVVAELADAGDPKLLQRLRTEAAPALLEMAAWRNPGHSLAAREILTRINVSKSGLQ